MGFERLTKVDFDTGVSVGDVNRDGLPDVAVAEHYASSAKGRMIPAVSLYLNKGLNSKGNPVFQDVTSTAGLPSVASRNGDVNINDYDNDGWPDIAAGVAVSRTRPALFRSLGLTNGVPRFAVPAGGLGDPKALIGHREIAATDGYTAGVPDDAHFGLGANTAVDVRVTLPPDSRGLTTNGVIDLRDVPADRYLRLPNGCGGG